MEPDFVYISFDGNQKENFISIYMNQKVKSIHIKINECLVFMMHAIMKFIHSLIFVNKERKNVTIQKKPMKMKMFFYFALKGSENKKKI